MPKPAQKHEFKRWVEKPETLKNAKLAFRPNFSGRVNDFNEEGVRRFTVRIDDSERAQDLIDKGWYVKSRMSRDDPDEVDFYFIEIKIGYGNPRFTPPLIKMITSKTGKPTVLTEETVGLLDEVNILAVNVTFRPNNWYQRQTGKEYASAYLARLTALVEEEDFLDEDFDEFEGGPVVIKNENVTVYDDDVPSTTDYDDEIPF